ncbi:MAG TPA: hypothetical protein VGK73_16970 [Polyangiaceae bacterium]
MSLPTKTRRSVWALLFGAVVLAAPPARADTEAIRIEYRAPESCPTAADFNAEVFQRTASARLADEGEAARTFNIVIERSGFGVTGSLVIREPDGATVARKVSGKDCTDVATVLALATALAIDPRAELDIAMPSTVESPATEPPVTAPTAKPGPVVPPPPDVEQPESPPLPPRGPKSWNATVGPTFAFGVAPRVAVGGSLFIEYGDRTPGVPLSSLGLDLMYLETAPEDVAGASATFRFFLARPRACFFALGRMRGPWLAPCLGMDLGAVTGEGSDIPHHTSRSRFWSSVDGLLRFGVGLGEAFLFEVEGGFGLPITRYQFVFRNPDTSIYDVPAVTGLAAARIGVRL